ncbi:MAG: EboA domain-containing protein [Bacteroidota bacterium]
MKTEPTYLSTEAEASFLKEKLIKTVGGEISTYFQQLIKGLAGDQQHRTFFMAFGSAPRRLGKGQLLMDKAAIQQALSINPDWTPWTWEADEVLRVWLILQIPSKDKEAYIARIMEVYETADMRELAVIMKVLPLTAYPESFVRIGEEGVRTNMSNVLEAIALHNVYPSRYFSENAWNQMFLKCIFTDRTIYNISGIDDRNNPELTRIIIDYAHERWAASRTVTPEIWRPVAPYLGKKNLSDIEKVINNENHIQQIAGALVCMNSGVDDFKQLLAAKKGLSDSIRTKKLDWDWVGRAWEQSDKT